MGFFVSQVQNMQPIQGLFSSWDHFLAGHTERLEPKTDLVDDVGAQNLALWVLQQRPHVPGDIRKPHALDRFSVELDLALHESMIGVRDKPVHAAHQGRLAAAGRPSQQHHLPRFQPKVDVLNRGCSP